MRMPSFARRHPWIGLLIVVTIGVASWMLLLAPHPATEPVSLAAVGSEASKPAGPPWLYGRADARFTVVEYDGVLVGCAALYPFIDERAAEMACVAVVPEHRRAGLGEMLLKRIESRSRAIGVERLFVLTTRTSDWFRERGFRQAPPDELPRQKREMYDVSRRSKVFMKSL
jgi:N-acetylglutamate synthase-like GNAT family acetyltransferase